MHALAYKIKRICKLLNGIAVLVTALLAFPIFYDALARKAGAPTTWVFEMSQYALITGSFLANASALKQGNHFRVQLMFSLFPRWKRLLDDLALAATLAFGLVVLVAGGMLTHYSFVNGIRSASIFSVPLYLPQMMVPLGGLALVLQALAMLVLRQVPAEDMEFE
ncbi:TRAP transporter small permease subunit [Pelomicrobium methylotrophicum]|uniref:TRAP transporter small permease protein n=1 Tax=Pelomicrobium methylotrophicum TaxID=2602750 RepID=A0A5C7EQX1_9PROT|nr:TRAP transporter small permease [Pelomicrobium methylotrophicum]TXF10968.1 TRAP transporter small permease [Pelomicrobium methylotrophicum]